MYSIFLIVFNNISYYLYSIDDAKSFPLFATLYAPMHRVDVQTLQRTMLNNKASLFYWRRSSLSSGEWHEINHKMRRSTFALKSDIYRVQKLEASCPLPMLRWPDQANIYKHVFCFLIYFIITRRPISTLSQKTILLSLRKR